MQINFHVQVLFYSTVDREKLCI